MRMKRSDYLSFNSRLIQFLDLFFISTIVAFASIPDVRFLMFRGFDFGNHFCEFMYEYKDEHEDGFKTYHDGYPTKEEQVE